MKKLARISVRGAAHRVLGIGQRQSQHSRRVDGRKTSSTGYEYLHVMIDDHSRVAYAELLDDLTSAAQSPSSAAASPGSPSAASRAGGDERQRLLLIATSTPPRSTSSAVEHHRIRRLPPEDERQAERLMPDHSYTNGPTPGYTAAHRRFAAEATSTGDNYRRRLEASSHQPPGGLETEQPALGTTPSRLCKARRL